MIALDVQLEQAKLLSNNNANEDKTQTISSRDQFHNSTTRRRRRCRQHNDDDWRRLIEKHSSGEALFAFRWTQTAAWFSGLGAECPSDVAAPVALAPQRRHRAAPGLGGGGVSGGRPSQARTPSRLGGPSLNAAPPPPCVNQFVQLQFSLTTKPYMVCRCARSAMKSNDPDAPSPSPT
jgi:hypothetical protein